MARLAIIAGKGAVPFAVAQSAKAQGWNVFVFPIEDQADADFSTFTVQPIRLGALGQTLQYFQDCDCTELVMVGKVIWPPLSTLQPDTVGLKFLDKIAKRGDDSILRSLSNFFAKCGVKTLPVQMFLDGQKMPLGLLAGFALDDVAFDTISIGAKLLKILGDSDVGQSIIVQNGRVLAIEAAEGTNAMLLRSQCLIDRSSGPTVFVKMQKSGQDLRLDTPFIGLETVYAAATVGVTVLAIEAHKVLLADDLNSMVTACDNRGITLVGILEPGLV